MKHDNFFDQFKVSFLQEKSFKMFNHAQIVEENVFFNNIQVTWAYHPGNILRKLIIKMAPPENSYLSITLLFSIIFREIWGKIYVLRSRRKLPERNRRKNALKTKSSGKRQRLLVKCKQQGTRAGPRAFSSLSGS